MSAVMVKVRAPGDKRFAFLTPRGGTNHLRVHASIFEDRDGETGAERAQRLIDSCSPDNPGWEWKIINAYEETN